MALGGTKRDKADGGGDQLGGKGMQVKCYDVGGRQVEGPGRKAKGYGIGQGGLGLAGQGGDELAEGGALIVQFYVALGRGGIGIGQGGKVGQVGIGQARVGDQDGVDSARAMGQDGADPIGQGHGVVDIACYHRQFKPLGIGIGADGEGGGQKLGEEKAVSHCAGDGVNPALKGLDQ